MNKTVAIRQNIMFFANNAGYCTPPGRMACAKALANAEQEAILLDLEVTWEHELDPDTSWMDTKDLKQLENGHIKILHARIELNGEYIASLGNICLKLNDPYQRVIEAELFQEALTYIGH